MPFVLMGILGVALNKCDKEGIAAMRQGFHIITLMLCKWELYRHPQQPDEYIIGRHTNANPSRFIVDVGITSKNRV